MDTIWRILITMRQRLAARRDRLADAVEYLPDSHRHRQAQSGDLGVEKLLPLCHWGIRQVQPPRLLDMAARRALAEGEASQCDVADAAPTLSSQRPRETTAMDRKDQTPEAPLRWRNHALPGPANRETERMEHDLGEEAAREPARLLGCVRTPQDDLRPTRSSRGRALVDALDPARLSSRQLNGNGSLAMNTTFVEAATILLREGLEAILVLAALAAYLGRSGAEDRLAALWSGAAAALVASVAAAWVFEHFYNGAHSDIFEGVIIFL